MFKDGKIPMDTGNVHSISSSIISQVVNETDNVTMTVIENYIKLKEAQGEIISSNIIPEGKLRHIINLGISTYNNIQQNHNITPNDLFPQEQYIEFLRKELLQEQYENQKLKNQIAILNEGGES